MIRIRGIYIIDAPVGSGDFIITLRSGDGHSLTLTWHRGAAFVDRLTAFEVIRILRSDILYYYWSSENYERWDQICHTEMGTTKEFNAVSGTTEEFNAWKQIYIGVQRLLGEDFFAQYLEMEGL